MKQEVRRGRKFVEYHDPDTQDKRTFTQEISGADVSYQDEGGAWQQLVEDWETDGADGFSFRASRMNHKVRFDSIGAWRWYPRRNVETEYLVINRPRCYLTATKRWGNLLVNGIIREGKTITLTSFRNVTRVIHSRWNGIKTDWILLNANAPTRFRQKIDLVGITYADGAIYGADGQRLGVLTPTTATDANGAALPCAGSYSGGYIEFSADVTGAAFPVTIDPDFSVQPDAAAGADTYICSWTAYRDYNYGVATNLQTYPSGMDTNRGLIKFDLSSIPTSATVSAGSLGLYQTTTTTDKTAKFHRSLVQWYEGNKNNAALDSGVDGSTWNYRNNNGSVAWKGGAGGAAGSDWATDATDTETINNGSVTTFDITKDCAYWVANPSNNYGGWLLGDSSVYLRFASSDHATESYRPKLTVTYTTASAGNPHYYYAQL